VSRLLLSLLVLSACHTVYLPPEVAPEQEVGLRIPIDRGTGKPLLDVAEPEGFRGPTYDVLGPRLSGLSWETEVWPVTRRWYEISDEAGVAWAADSGLTWDEKYAAWVDAMGETTSEDGHVTVEILTPWGARLPSPRLECAEMAMFLRATFASWHELPFFLTAWHADVGDVHMGHMGIVDDDGRRLSGYPRFAIDYVDHRGDLDVTTPWTGSWPSDANLAAAALTQLRDDDVGFLGDDAFAGAYFDALFLNKRTGHLLLRLLTHHGSMHLASPTNTWDLAPEALREGDFVVQRWSDWGIGHVVVLKEVDEVDGQLDAEVVYGSMPRIQPRWYNEALSLPYLTSRTAGSGEVDGSGTPYSHYGGGLKRWRTPVAKDDHWVNIVPVGDRDHYLDDDDHEALQARPVQIAALLGDLTPEEHRDALLARIDNARDALREKPSSCTNRSRREEAFAELYPLMEEQFGMDRTEVDATYRLLEDHVFAELDYSQSKTCCWNQATAEMADIVLDLAEDEAADADAAGTCVEPTVFRAEAHAGDGYDRWADHAASLGRASDWRPWSADETCPWSDVAADTVLAAPATCTDSDEPVDDDPTDDSACGDLDWAGECAGDTVRWCEEDRVYTYSCPAHLTCSWGDDLDFYWCLPE
jgi:hypothetical protein